MEVTVEYELTKSDVMTACQPEGLPYTVAAWFLAAFAQGLAWFIHREGINELIFATSGIWLGLLILTQSRRILRPFLRHYDGQTHRVALRVDDRGLSAATHQGVLQGSWGAFYRIIEGGPALVFFLNPTQAVIVPKRVLSPAQLEHIRQLANDQLVPHRGWQRAQRWSTYGLVVLSLGYLAFLVAGGAA